MTTATKQDLLKEARKLANRINQDRFEGKMPSADDTVRLVEVTDLIITMSRELPVFSEYRVSEGT